MIRRARKWPRLLAVVAAILALAVWLSAWLPSAGARSGQHDAQVTWAYLQTEVALFRTVVVNAHLGVRRGNELVEHVAKECPGALRRTAKEKGSRKRAELRGKLRKETFETVALALLTPDLAADRQAASALARLRWSSRKLTKLVHRHARIEAAASELRLPDLCGDLKEWAAGGYTTLPAGTRRFLAQYAATDAGGDLLGRIKVMLRSYEGPRERLLQSHMERLRARAGRLIVAELVPLVRKTAARLGFGDGLAGEPTTVPLQPPATVVQSGGERLADFYAGRKVAAQSGCLACHRIGEAGNRGPGPDLTHVGSRLTGTQIARALINPKAPMPSFRNMPQRKFNALVEFLSVLR